MDLDLILQQLMNSNKIYTFASPRPQNFVLSYPVIKYIFTNPSSGKAWKKLIQTCKYFFSKNPIYPGECLQCVDENKWNADGESFDPTKNVAKLWIYDKIYVATFAPSLLSSLMPKIYKCGLRSLAIFRQDLTFDEYQFLTSAGDLKELELYRCTISHSDGTLVTFDQLFINCPELECFTVMDVADNSSSMFQRDTFKKFAEVLPRFKKLSRFNLDGLTEKFDFSTIDDFLLKNENLLIYLRFSFPFFSGYKEILEQFIIKIIETPPKRIPLIEFPGFKNSIYFKDYGKLYEPRI